MKQRLAAVGEMAAGIAHEIRNPLAAIRYSAQLLAESPKLDSEDKRLVDIINNHCTRANDVVENILQLSRRERSRPETLDLNAWILAFVEEYKQSNDLGGDHLRAVTQNRTIEAMVDPQHLQQVVWNLVQNAIRYGRQPNEPARVSVISRIRASRRRWCVLPHNPDPGWLLARSTHGQPARLRWRRRRYSSFPSPASQGKERHTLCAKG